MERGIIKSERAKNEAKGWCAMFYKTKFVGYDTKKMERDYKKIYNQYKRMGKSDEEARELAEFFIEYYRHQYRKYEIDEPYKS